MNKYISLFQVTLGIFSTVLGLKGFLIPNHFIDGGVTGISMLLSFIFNFPLHYFILVVNIPFLIIGYYQLGLQFFIKSLITMIFLTLGILFIPVPMVTHDTILSAVFGGFFIGVGIGLAIRGSSVLDGTEILALLLSKKTNLSIGDIILCFNIIIFLIGAYFLGVEKALYSIITYGSASMTIKFILKGIEEYTGVFIISEQYDDIKNRSYQTLQRGFTIFKGKGGYLSEDLSILYCVITRLEIPRLKKIIAEIDPAAFVVFHPVDEARGGIIGKRFF